MWSPWLLHGSFFTLSDPGWRAKRRGWVWGQFGSQWEGCGEVDEGGGAGLIEQNVAKASEVLKVPCLLLLGCLLLGIMMRITELYVS